MTNFQSIADFCRKPGFILGFILLAFFLRGVFLATLFPIFTGQDEARHYSSVQYRAEPREKTWEKIDRPFIEGKQNIEDYNFSEEMIHAGEAADFDVFRHQLYNTVNFSEGYDGFNEKDINSKIWKPYNFFKQPDIVGGKSLYHDIAAVIEKSLGDSNILVRFFSNRIFSVFLATIGIFLAYLIMRNIGFKEKTSLILTAIIAFQPKYAMYTTNINYDVLLIPLFFLFTLGAVLSLRQGLNWKNILIMLLAIGLGFFTKATSLIMLLPFFGLLIYFAYKSYKERINLKMVFLAIAAFLIIASFSHYDFLSIVPFKENVPETINSLDSYLSKSLTLGRFGLSSRTYWGSLGWFSNVIDKNFTDIIWVIEVVSAVGIFIFLFSKKKFEFLPKKKYVIFLLGMIIALQFGLRLADWKTFIVYGNLELGTPGRYFLPNLVSHIALVFIGLGALLRKENYFKNAMLAGLILMFSFSMYIIFNIVLLRYYL